MQVIRYWEPTPVIYMHIAGVIPVAKKKKLSIVSGLNSRYSFAMRELMRRVHDGAIGDIDTLRIYRVHGPCHTPPISPDEHELKFQLSRGVRFNWLSSGFFVDWHCHNVDVACWAKDAWPINAQAIAGQQDRNAGNLLDHYSIEFTAASCWSTRP